MLNDETQRGKYMMNCSHGSQAATDCSKSCSIVSARQNIFMFRAHHGYGCPQRARYNDKATEMYNG